MLIANRFSMSARISVLVHSRNAFLGLIIIISVLKLFLSWMEPASFDLRDIIRLSKSSYSAVGPWIALYPPLYSPSATNSTRLEQWVLAPPPSMDLNLHLISLLFRLPVFAFDLATVVVLYYVGSRVASPREGRLASLLWFANPFSLFAIELLGVPDIVATFLVIVAFSLFISRRPLWGGVFLGAGIWVKLYPILILPPLLMWAHAFGVSWRRMTAVLCLALIGLAGYLSWISPLSDFYLTHYTPVTQPVIFLAGQLAGQSSVNVTAFGMILFYCLLWLFARQSKNLIATLLPTFLIYYALSNPAPQYLIWAMPLMALDVVLITRSRSVLYGIFYVLAFAQWFFISPVPAFLTPSGYSLLLIPLGGGGIPWYSKAIGSLLDSSVVSILLLPLAASMFFASEVVYALDIARSWFNALATKSWL